MSHIAPPVNTIAPLKNVGLLLSGMEQAMNRPLHLPGIITFHGPSGYGKSCAVGYVANATRAYLVEVKSEWTKSALCESILKEMGIVPKKAVWRMVAQIGDQLSLSGRPLIIDEAGHALVRGMSGTIKDIYESSKAAIALVGEELLPTMINQEERLASRVLEPIPALPADLEDAALLAGFYLRGVEVEEGLLQLLVTKSKGSVRRICVNLWKIKDAMLCEGVKVASLDWWGDRDLYTGEMPGRRV